MPGGIEIFLGAHAGDLGRDIEQRLCHLARDHVHFIIQGDGDEHVRIARPGILQDRRIRAVPQHTTGIEHVIHPLHQFLGRIDDADVIAFSGEPFGDAIANLTGTTNDDLHAREPSTTSFGTRCTTQDIYDSTLTHLDLLERGFRAETANQPIETVPSKRG